MKTDSGKSIYFYGIEFTVQKNGKLAVCKLDYETKMDGYDTTSEQTVVKVISLWVDEYKNKAIQAYLKLNLAGNLMHRKIQKYVTNAIQAKCPDGGMSMSVSSDGILCYGPKFGLTYDGSTPDTYDQYSVYQTKALAIKAMIESAGSYVQVAGLQDVDLSQIKSDVLVQFGFVPIQDEMKLGRIMWRGNPNNCFAGGASGWSNRKDKRTNVDGFLNMLQSDLQTKFPVEIV